MKRQYTWKLAILLGLAPWMVGCGGQKEEFQEYTAAEKTEEHDHDHDHGHVHGPHDGHVIDLGDHEYMAEVVYDEATHAVGVYILDHDKMEPLAIEATEISAHLHLGEKEAEYKLAAKPQEGDGEGKASFFELAGNEVIAEHVSDIEDVQGEVIVTISGKEYEGIVGEGGHDHDHDHEEDHDHDHDEEKKE